MWGNGDDQAVSMLMENLAPDIRWCSIADGCEGAKFSRERNGIDEIQGYFEDIFEEWEMIHFTTEEFIGERNRLVMVGSINKQVKLSNRQR